MRRLLLLPFLLFACSSGEVQRLREQNRQLREQLSRRSSEARRVLPPAQVLSVRDSMVLISIGILDGVEPGDEVQLRRGDTYVGAMTVRKVYLDSAVGELSPSPSGPHAPPQYGDTTYTKE